MMWKITAVDESLYWIDATFARQQVISMKPQMIRKSEINIIYSGSNLGISNT